MRNLFCKAGKLKRVSGSIYRQINLFSCNPTRLLHRYELRSAELSTSVPADGSSWHLPGSKLCRHFTSSLLVPNDRSKVWRKVRLTSEYSHAKNFRLFYQCGLQGSPPVWSAFIMTCQCSTFFDYEMQSCQSLWDWIPWCRNHPTPLPPVTPCWKWLRHKMTNYWFLTSFI